MAGPTRISQLTDGSPVQPTDQVPVARGSGATGFTYKVNAERIVSDLFNVSNTPTVNLAFDASTRTLSAAIASDIQSNINDVTQFVNNYQPPQIANSSLAKAFVNFNSNSSLASVNYFTPGIYTWTAPTGVTQVTVRVVGGGGGGGGGAAGTYGGGGGGGGANKISTISVVAGQTYAVVVGSGGSGGVRYAFGSNGGQSAFYTISSNGGMGGQSGFAGMNYTGGSSGGTGGTNGGNGTYLTGGSGGNSFGSGGLPQGGSASNNSGGGGAGGQYSSGGNGGSGRVEIAYSISGGVSIINSLNVDSITRNSQGVYTIAFASGTFSNNNYTYVGSARSSLTTNTALVFSSLSQSKTLSSLSITVKDSSSNGVIDSSEICVVCYSN